MSEQEVPKIDWSQETDFSKIEYAEQLKDAARDCRREMFVDLVEGFSKAEAEDGRLGIEFIKDGVEECQDPQQKASKKAFIAGFEGDPSAAAQQEQAPAAAEREAVQDVVAPAKQAAPVRTNAADSQAIADLTEAFRAVSQKVRTLETRVISQAAEIETLTSEGQKDKTAIRNLTSLVEGLLEAEETRQSTKTEAEPTPKKPAFAKIDLSGY